MTGKHRIAERVRDTDFSGVRKFFEAVPPGSIYLGIGQPDFQTPEHIKEAGIEAIRQNKTGYTPTNGIPELCGAISEKCRRENGLSYAPEQVIVTAGASEAIYIALQTLVENGDTVLCPEPGFVINASATQLANGNAAFYPHTPDMHIDVEACKERMDGARVIIINSPRNPTGAVESEETIRAVVEYAGDKGVTVISDEVYEHFVYEKPHVSCARFGEDVITVNATSKTYAMTGWRIGFVAGPLDYIEQMKKVHMFSQVNATSIAQYAALAAYSGPQDCVIAMREEYRRRRDLLLAGLAGCGYECTPPEGAFYLFANLGPDGHAAFKKAGVIGIPGEVFGASTADYLRLSYAASEATLKEAIRRLEAVSA